MLIRIEGKIMKFLVFTTLAIVALMAGFSSAAPEPTLVPGPYDWTLDVKFEHPQQIMLRFKGEAKPRRFWYTILTLTNNTDMDVNFYPKCELMTDTFEIISAGQSTPPVAFDKIKRRHKARYPFLELWEKAGNRILQGEDNTKDIAIIWPDFDGKARGVDLFIAGLSNETVTVDHPTAKDQQGDPVKIYLRKTLRLNYSIRSDAAFRANAQLTFNEKSWIMR